MRGHGSQWFYIKKKIRILKQKNLWSILKHFWQFLKHSTKSQTATLALKRNTVGGGIVVKGTDNMPSQLE